MNGHRNEIIMFLIKKIQRTNYGVVAVRKRIKPNKKIL